MLVIRIGGIGMTYKDDPVYKFTKRILIVALAIVIIIIECFWGTPIGHIFARIRVAIHLQQHPEETHIDSTRKIWFRGYLVGATTTVDGITRRFTVEIDEYLSCKSSFYKAKFECKLAALARDFIERTYGETVETSALLFTLERINKNDPNESKINNNTTIRDIRKIINEKYALSFTFNSPYACVTRDDAEKIYSLISYLKDVQLITSHLEISFLNPESGKTNTISLYSNKFLAATDSGEIYRLLKEGENAIYNKR